mgnify:CR=1 FL=1
MAYPQFDFDNVPKPIRSEDDVENNVTTYYFVQNKGTGFNKHLHDHEHIITCTKGSMRIYHGENDTYTITAGDPPAKMELGVIHASENLEDGTEFYITHPLGLM